jgi:hypothetical protein
VKTLLSVIALSVIFQNAAVSNVYVTFSGDTVKVWDTAFQWSCGGKFLPVTRISQDTVYVTERDTMHFTTCLCYFDVCTNLTGLQPATYTAMVTRRHEEHFNDTVYVNEVLAGSVTFTILNSISQSSTSIYQSPCRNDPQSVSEAGAVPNEFGLLTSYPNPFNPRTTIRYSIPNASFVTLNIYNMLGQHLATLVDQRKDAGSYEAVFDSRNLSSGIYVCRLIFGKQSISHRLVLQK